MNHLIGRATNAGAILLLTATLNAQNLYGANYYGSNIGEYGLDGSTVNASLISTLSYPSDIAISGNDLFVTDYGSGTIGEYTTSGATVNESLISGFGFPNGIAISPVPEPSTGALMGVGAAALWLRRCRKWFGVSISRVRRSL